MMEQQEKIKDSPFYVEYTGNIDEHFTITTTASFNKALAKHLNDKYPNEKNKQGKHNFSKCVRLLLENYLNLQCISRTSYDNYKIVLIVGDNHLGTENIIPYGVIKNKSDERFLSGTSKHLYWANVNEKVLNERYDESDLSQIENYVEHYQKQFDCGGVYVVDLPLNNFFDEYADGVYSYNAENQTMHRGASIISTFNDVNPTMHCGVNIITRKDNVYCVVYTWYLNVDYKPIIDSIGFADLEQTMQDLSGINENAYANFKVTINAHDKKFPKDTVESLKKQYDTLQESIDKFEDAKKFAKEQQDAIKLKLDELTK